jgi:eukaryotic-like serine/threonine-protein kinase
LIVKLSPGDIVDQKYRIMRLLGTGGMGSVYEAENTRVDRRVAIKVMHKVRDQQDIARFEREARAAQIGSPHIVQVFDLGNLADGDPYMVMEYLAGESLGERLQRVQRLHPAELLPIAGQVLDALEAAHRAGIIHRDLKPDNVFLARFGGSTKEIVKLLDFGISKFADAARKVAEVSLTKSGVAVGTPQYMSPEQVQGAKSLDYRTDLYSLGVICYRCLSGQLPFQSEDVAPLLLQILLENARPIHEVQADIDPRLSALVARGMARNPQERFQTAAEFRAALVEWESVFGSGVVPAPAPSLPGNAQGQAGTKSFVTNAPWASTAATSIPPQRTVRTMVVAALLSVAGIAGMLVAYRLWTSGRTDQAMAATSSAIVQAVPLAPRAALPQASVDVQPSVGVAPPDAAQASSSVKPRPPAVAALPSPGRAAPEHSFVTSPASAASVEGASPAVAASAAPSSPRVNATENRPKAEEDTDDSEDNRHMSRGFH